VHGGRWRDEHEWPLARTRFTDYYLHADGSLKPDPPRGASSATTYRFDPARPVPSIGGNVSSLRDVRPLPAGLADPSYAGRAERTVDVMRPGGFDQREAPGFHGCRPPYLPLGSRPDVLVFQTEPLREPTEVTGPIEVHLWVATSAVDTDFTAKLIDVYPPSAWYPQGYALQVNLDLGMVEQGADIAGAVALSDGQDLVAGLQKRVNIRRAASRVRWP
jgi:uncharacterized protein